MADTQATPLQALSAGDLRGAWRAADRYPLALRFRWYLLLYARLMRAGAARFAERTMLRAVDRPVPPLLRLGPTDEIYHWLIRPALHDFPTTMVPFVREDASFTLAERCFVLFQAGHREEAVRLRRKLIGARRRSGRPGAGPPCLTMRQAAEFLASLAAAQPRPGNNPLLQHLAQSPPAPRRLLQWAARTAFMDDDLGRADMMRLTLALMDAGHLHEGRRWLRLYMLLNRDRRGPTYSLIGVAEAVGDRRAARSLLGACLGSHDVVFASVVVADCRRLGFASLRRRSTRERRRLAARIGAGAISQDPLWQTLRSFPESHLPSWRFVLKVARSVLPVADHAVAELALRCGRTRLARAALRLLALQGTRWPLLVYLARDQHRAGFSTDARRTMARAISLYENDDEAGDATRPPHLLIQGLARVGMKEEAERLAADLDAVNRPCLPEDDGQEACEQALREANRAQAGGRLQAAEDAYAEFLALVHARDEAQRSR